MEFEGFFEDNEGLGKFADGEGFAYEEGGFKTDLEFGYGAFGKGDEAVEEGGDAGWDGCGVAHGRPFCRCVGEGFAWAAGEFRARRAKSRGRASYQSPKDTEQNGIYKGRNSNVPA